MPRAKPTRRARPRKKSARATAFKFVLLLLLVPILVVAGFLIRYYYIFDGNIELKLGKKSQLAQTSIYAAPLVIYPGKRIGLAELETRVRWLGYEEEGRKGPDSSSYRVDSPNLLTLHNSRALPYNGARTVEIACSGGAIRTIVDARSRAPIERFSLKPALLSNAIDKNREKRRVVAYREIPEVLIKAVLAAEDRRFFSHGGIDPIRIIQALIVDLREGEAVQGASTLTQQFVKNYFLTPDRTWRRKFADAYMAILLEKRLSKTQIFELYCNEVYLGQIGSFSIVGFGEAADSFFGKRVKDLTLEEAATLAGIITAPNRYTPLRYPDRALVRRNLVLDQMLEYGMISAGERDQAKALPLRVEKTSILNYSGAPYFVDYVQRQLVESYGEAELARARWRVHTTLDTDLQKAAFEAVQSGMAELDAHFAAQRSPLARGTIQASLIAVDPKTGDILAMIGGRNYGVSQFNRITESKRQPGSIFKPFVYAAALETAYHSASPLTVISTVLDQPTRFTFGNLEYAPGNFKDEYLGQVTLRQAITKSLNIATIKVAEKIGYGKVTELARRLGLNEQIKPYPAMAIGAFEITPLEMVQAYTAFANGGIMSPLGSVRRIDDPSGNRVAVQRPAARQALTPEIAFLVTSLLESVINNGTGAGARTRGFVLPAAGKTGTSHDGWFAGYTPDLLCIVWVGLDDNRELGLSGSQSALPIWTEFMKKAAALRPLKGESFAPPKGVSEREVDPSTGLLATARCLQREKDFFVKGTEPTLECYGDNYEQSVGSGAPVSIYSTPPKGR